MKALALDVGEKRIGIAVSDELKMIATPLTVLNNDPSFFDELEKIIKEKEISEIAVGLPFTLKGEVGHQAKRILGFIEELKGRTDKKIILIDERFTTKITKEVLKGKKRKEIDKYSAALILESYLENERNN
jgi:putative holliday junction resolvase